MSFLDELVKKGLITKEQLNAVRALADEKYQGNIDKALLALGVLEDQLIVAKGEYFNMPTAKVDVKKISFDILNFIPEDSATYYHFVPFALIDDVLQVGITDPENIQGIDALQFISQKIGKPFKIFLLS